MISFKKQFVVRAQLVGICLAAPLLLTACGGGGGGDNSGNNASTSPDALIITGTAATGKAIPSAKIDAKCEVGTGTTTSLADGTYKIAIEGGKFPCLVEITNPADGSKLHSTFTGSGNAGNANITPLTEMLAARLLRNNPTEFFKNFQPAVANSNITTTNLKVAQTDVNEILKGTVDTSSIADFNSTPLKAATPGNPSGGDSHDQLLDNLGTKIDNTRLNQIIPVIANTTSTTDVKRVLTSLTTGKGLRPTIGWNVSITPKIYTYVMQLCFAAQCDAVGGPVLMDVDPNDTVTVQGLANGIPYGDVTRSELQQIITAGTKALNDLLGDLWTGTTTPNYSIVKDVINSALATAKTPEEVISLAKASFIKRGYPAAAGITASGSGTSGTALGGYQCPTTKTVLDPDWMQSHESIWLAADTHDSYTACLKAGAANCEAYYTQETQLCSYGVAVCKTVATNPAVNCPG